MFALYFHPLEAYLLHLMQLRELNSDLLLRPMLELVQILEALILPIPKNGIEKSQMSIIVGSQDDFDNIAVALNTGCMEDVLRVTAACSSTNRLLPDSGGVVSVMPASPSFQRRGERDARVFQLPAAW